MARGDQRPRRPDQRGQFPLVRNGGYGGKRPWRASPKCPSALRTCTKGITSTSPCCGRCGTTSPWAPAPPPSAPARPTPGARSSPSCTSTTHKRCQGTAQPSPAKPGGGFFVGGPGPLSTWGGGTTPPLRKPWATALWCRGSSPFCLRRRCSPSSSARPCGSWRNRGPAPSKGAGGDCGFAGEGV